MTTSSQRLNLLRRLLMEGKNSTQEDLREGLAEAGFDVNQSTISRDLNKLGAMKGKDSKGRVTYKLSESAPEAPSVVQSIGNLIIDFTYNDAMIVILTTPGSASLVARHLDMIKPGNILGTIAGDDTIFVAPARGISIPKTIQAIKDSF